MYIRIGQSAGRVIRYRRRGAHTAASPLHRSGRRRRASSQVPLASAPPSPEFSVTPQPDERPATGR